MKLKNNKSIEKVTLSVSTLRLILLPMAGPEDKSQTYIYEEGADYDIIAIPRLSLTPIIQCFTL